MGVGGAAVSSGSHVRPSHSCDGWVCDLGTVDVSSIFGLIRGTGAFTPVLPTFVSVSRMQLVEQYVLTRTSAVRVGLGVGGVTIVSGSCGLPSYSWISRLLTSSLSLGSSLVCFVVLTSVCESCRFLNSSF